MQLLQWRGTDRSKSEKPQGAAPTLQPCLASDATTPSLSCGSCNKRSGCIGQKFICQINMEHPDYSEQRPYAEAEAALISTVLLQIQVTHNTSYPCFRKIRNCGGIYQIVPPSFLCFFCPSHNCTFLAESQSISGNKGRHHHWALNWTGWSLFSPNPCNNRNTRDLNSEQRRKHLSDRIEEIKAFLPLIEWPQYHITSAPAAAEEVIEPWHRGLAEWGRGQILSPEF